MFLCMMREAQCRSNRGSLRLAVDSRDRLMMMCVYLNVQVCLSAVWCHSSFKFGIRQPRVKYVKLLLHKIIDLSQIFQWVKKKSGKKKYLDEYFTLHTHFNATWFWFVATEETSHIDFPLFNPLLEFWSSYSDLVPKLYLLSLSNSSPNVFRIYHIVPQSGRN